MGRSTASTPIGRGEDCFRDAPSLKRVVRLLQNSFADVVPNR